jgi:hypothetical protein
MYGSFDAAVPEVAVEDPKGATAVAPVVAPAVPDALVADDGVEPLVAGDAIDDEGDEVDDEEGVLSGAAIGALDEVVPVADAPDVVLDESVVCACVNWANTITADASKIFGGLIMETPF